MALKILKTVKEEKKIHKVRTEVVKQRQTNMDQNHKRIILKCLINFANKNNIKNKLWMHNNSSKGREKNEIIGIFY